MSFSTLPALADITAKATLPYAMVGDRLPGFIANISNSEILKRFADYPQSVTAALFAIVFFGTGTATVASAGSFLAAHALVKLASSSCFNLGVRAGNRIAQDRCIGNTKVTAIIDNVDYAFFWIAKITNTAAAIFMAYKNPAKPINIVAALALSMSAVITAKKTWLIHGDKNYGSKYIDGKYV